MDKKELFNELNFLYGELDKVESAIKASSYNRDDIDSQIDRFEIWKTIDKEISSYVLYRE